MSEIEKEPTAAKQSVHNESVSDKLLEFQKRVSAISKDSVNPFFKSKYFDVNTVIDTIKPILNEVGLVVLQPLGWYQDRTVLKTVILDGEKVLITSEVELPQIADVQKFGAAITYFRRYALVSLLLLQGEEDDDGNGAVKPNLARTAIKTGGANSATQSPKDSTPTANKGLPMSEKQNKMIHALMKEKGLTSLKEAGIEKIEHPTLTDASAIIKKLMEYTAELPTIQMDQPYVEGHEND